MKIKVLQFFTIFKMPEMQGTFLQYSSEFYRDFQIIIFTIVFNNFEEPGEKSFIEIRRVLPPAAARLAHTAHLPDRP